MSNQRFFGDVGIIGAGLAGLTCAKQLQQLGLKVVVLEKSSGVGGRVATRRLHDTCVDHGLPYLTEEGKQTQGLIERLSEMNIIQPWNAPVTQWPTVTELRYICPSGMTAIAKSLATNLDVWRNFCVTRLTPTEEKTWLISGDSSDNPNNLEVKAIVIAIPAPQAMILLEASMIPDLEPDLNSLRMVEYDACFTVMAGYKSEHQQEIEQIVPFKPFDIDIFRISLESSKRPESKQPVFVLQTSPAYVEKHLDTDNLEVLVPQLLNHASQFWFSWLNSPEWFQVHRWRYAFPRRGLSIRCLVMNSPLPLIGCGDWCEGNNESEDTNASQNYVEQALNSGIAAAEQISYVLTF